MAAAYLPRNNEMYQRANEIPTERFGNEELRYQAVFHRLQAIPFVANDTKSSTAISGTN